jgi:hypothetical protein
MGRCCREAEFLDYARSGNLFEMVVDLVQLGREQGESWAQRTEELLKTHLLISYEELREVSLHPRDGESAIVATMKTAFGYVPLLLVRFTTSWSNSWSVSFFSTFRLCTRRCCLRQWAL